MRMETKTVQVANKPSVINEVNNFESVWGWNVLGVQITDQKIVREGDTYGTISASGINTTTQIITEHTNYATITYQRDMDDPFYARRAAMERKYHEAESENFLTPEEISKLDACYKVLEEEEKYRKLSKTFMFIAIGIAAFSSFCLGLIGSNLVDTIAVIALVGAIVMMIKFRKNSKAPAYLNAHAEVDGLHAVTETRRQEYQEQVLNDARKLHA